MALRHKAIVLGLVLVLAGCTRRANAQFIGYVSPQTVQQTLATNQPCSGAVQTFPVQNLGQTQHFASISSTGATSLSVQIQGVDSSGNVFALSDAAQNPGFGGPSTSTVSGGGYYPIVQVQVSCTPAVTATFTLSYSGCSSCTSYPTGDFLKSQIDRLMLNNVPGNANASGTAQTPFGNSAGTVSFQYNGAGAGGGSLTVQCSNSFGIFGTIFTASIANNSNVQTFPIPNFSCLNVKVLYGNSGAAGTVLVDYVFAKPGAEPLAYQAAHITGTTATAVKATAPAVLHTVSVNTGGAGTVSVFDLASAACTGTPATNVKAVITATATTLQTFTYDEADFANGICVKASAAMDLTVSFQ